MTTFNAQPIVCYHSAQANGTGAISITNVASIAKGDILFVPVATQGGEAAPTPTCTGLTFATVDTYRSSGTGVGSVRLTLFWARVGTDAVGTTISVGDSGDHTIGRVTSIKNLPLTGDPWHAVAGNTEATSDTSGSATGLTTTANNAVILVYAARGNDSASGTAYSAWTNASLTYVQELWEGGTTDGSGGGIAVAGGPRPTAGTVSATTYTLSAAAQKAHITLALVGRSVENVIVGTDAALPNVYSTYFSWTTFADVFGNSKGFKDNSASGSGDICLFGKCRKGAYGSDTRAVLFWSASTSGTSWTPVELFGGTTDAFWFGFLKCGMQSSDGKLHLCWANLSTNYLVYYRLTPTYTSGHITGYTQDVSFNLIAYATESRVEFQDVVAPDSTHRLMVCLETHNTDNTVYTGYFGTMPLTASSASDLVGLDGNASLTQVEIWSGTSASHEHAMLFRQDPSTGDIHVAYGYVMTEASAIPLRRRRLAPSTGITWTVGSETIETTDTANSMVSGMYGNSNGVYRLSIDNARQVHIDRLNGDTLTQDVFPVVAMPITATSSGNAILGVNNAGTEAYIAVVEYSGYSQCGLCVDGVWTMSPVYAGYTSVLGIGGVGWSSGVAGIFMQNVNSLTADHYMSVIREGSAVVSATGSGGAVAGGSATVGRVQSILPSTGAIAGGSATARGHVPGVVFEEAGAVAYSAGSGSTVATDFPSLTAGNPYSDGLVAFVHQKPATANGGGCTTPNGWTLRGSITGAGGYSTTLGADTGNTNLYVYTKDTVTGNETGTQTFDLTDNNVAAAQIHRISKQGSGAWLFSVATGSRNASADGNVSVQMSTNPGITVGDLLIGYFGIPTDVTTPTQFESESFSASGVTGWGTLAEVNEPDSGNGNDIGGVVIQNRVVTGTANAEPYFNATATGTTTNVRGPVAILRAREATPQTVSYTTDGGALSGGAASEARTWLQSVAGGALAGAAASMARTRVALVAAGAIAGGAASVTSGSASSVSYTAIGGALAGGTTTVTRVCVASASSGAITGGAATETRVGVRATAGGAVAAATAPNTRIANAAVTGGALAGGAATELRAVTSLAAGGAIVGGIASVTILASSSLSHTAVGGAVSGGAVVEKRASKGVVSGGCIAGGSATEKRTTISATAGGSLAGGIASVVKTRKIVATSGAIAGGEATEKRGATRPTAGGALAGATAATIQVRTLTATSGAIAGGEAAWASSAPKSYYYEGDGGALAGGTSRFLGLQLVTAVGGALAGGSATISRGSKSYVSGGALAGGAATEALIGVRRSTGGAITGGASQTLVTTLRTATGGALVGGSASVTLVQSGVLAYTARGGALAGGISSITHEYVAPPVVHIPASIKAFEFALYSVEKSTQEPMRPIYVGDTIPLVFETKERNGSSAGRLYDPTELVVTIRFEPSGVTDSITYGGSEASNVYLTRLSTGRYQLLYPAGATEGLAYIEARVSEDVAGVAYVADMLSPVRVPIQPLRTGHVDVPASV